MRGAALAVLAVLGVVLALGAWGVAGAASLPDAREPAPSGEATATVSALVAAMNAHDVDAALALFGDSATVQDDQQPQTREQIRAWLGQLARDNVRIDLRGRPMVGLSAPAQPTESVVWPATLFLTRERQMGGGPVDATVRAIVQGRRLASFSIRPNSGLIPVGAPR